MPFLYAEAAKLTQPTLEAGVVQTFRDFQYQTFTSKMPFRSAVNGKSQWNVETELSPGESARPLFGKDVSGGSSKRERIEVETRQLARDANTPLAAQVTMSDSVSQKAQDRHGESKKLAFDFARYLVQGMGTGPFPHGVDYYLARFNGLAQAGSDTAVKLNPSHNLIPEPRRIFNTQNGRVDGTQKALDPYALENLLTMHGGTGWDLLLTTRQVRNKIKSMLVALGGTTPQSVMEEDFGKGTFAWDGTPVVWSNFVGSKKSLPAAISASLGGATVNATTKELTVNSALDADDYYRWIGFSDLDVGRTVVLSTGGSHKIVNVLSPEKVVLDGTPVAGASVGFEVMPVENVIYGISFGTDPDGGDGFCAVYNDVKDADGSTADGMYENSFMGIAVVDRGRQDGRALKTEIDWFGTFRASSVWSIARLSHFSDPAM